MLESNTVSIHQAQNGPCPKLGQNNLLKIKELFPYIAALIYSVYVMNIKNMTDFVKFFSSIDQQFVQNCKQGMYVEIDLKKILYKKMPDEMEIQQYISDLIERTRKTNPIAFSTQSQDSIPKSDTNKNFFEKTSKTNHTAYSIQSQDNNSQDSARKSDTKKNLFETSCKTNHTAYSVQSEDDKSEDSIQKSDINKSQCNTSKADINKNKSSIAISSISGKESPLTQSSITVSNLHNKEPTLIRSNTIDDSASPLVKKRSGFDQPIQSLESLIEKFSM